MEANDLKSQNEYLLEENVRLNTEWKKLYQENQKLQEINQQLKKDNEYLEQDLRDANGDKPTNGIIVKGKAYACNLEYEPLEILHHQQ